MVLHLGHLLRRLGLKSIELLLQLLCLIEIAIDPQAEGLSLGLVCPELWHHIEKVLQATAVLLVGLVGMTSPPGRLAIPDELLALGDVALQCWVGCDLLVVLPLTILALPLSMPSLAMWFA